MVMQSEKHMAARLVHKRGMKKKAVFVHLPKTGGRTTVESGIEAELATIANLDCRVSAIRPQPFTIDLASGMTAPTRALLARRLGKPVSSKGFYTPDFELRLTSGRLVYLEAKHRRFLEKTPGHRDLPARMAHLGHRLVLLTESEIRTPLARNASLLRVHVAQVLAPGDAERVERAVAAPRSIRDIQDRHDLERRLVLRAIANGHLFCDLFQPITTETRVALCTAAPDYLELLPL